MYIYIHTYIYIYIYIYIKGGEKCQKLQFRFTCILTFTYRHTCTNKSC